jgi:hypothetical protein
MNRRTILALTTMALSAVALSAGDAMAQQRSLKDQLVGAWTLVSADATAPNGTKQQGVGGPNPKGILILDASGRYALATMKPDRPKFKTSGNVRLDTPAAEFGEAARAFASNFGTWSVNEATRP